MSFDKESALIEAILFLESDPVDVKTLMKITDFPKDVVEKSLEKLGSKYEEQSHGLEIVEFAGGYLLSPRQELWDYLKERYGTKNDKRLSKAALETLTIIAYSQPITKAEVENIRGVSADNMVRLLMDRELVKVTGKRDAPGRPAEYGTTKEFLKIFGLSSVADLPKLSEVDQKRFELNG